MSIPTLDERRSLVVRMLRSGKSVRAIARETGMHRMQIQRWKKNIRKSVAPCCPPSEEIGHIDRTFSVPSFSPNGQYEGQEVATWEHPVDHIEPEAVIPPKNKHNQILSAALRFLTYQEDRSMEEVAREIGCTKQAISRVLVVLSDQFGFKGGNQKDERAREAYRGARMRFLGRDDQRDEDDDSEGSDASSAFN